VCGCAQGFWIIEERDSEGERVRRKPAFCKRTIGQLKLKLKMKQQQKRSSGENAQLYAMIIGGGAFPFLWLFIFIFICIFISLLLYSVSSVYIFTSLAATEKRKQQLLRIAGMYLYPRASECVDADTIWHTGCQNMVPCCEIYT